MKEYIVTIGYPLFLENRRWRGFADNAQTAAEIVFRKASTYHVYDIEEYTGPKNYSYQCFKVFIRDKRKEAVAVFVEEVTNTAETV